MSTSTLTPTAPWTKSLPRHERLSSLKDRAGQAYETLTRRRAWTTSSRRAGELKGRVDVALRRWSRLGEALRREERRAS